VHPEPHSSATEPLRPETETLGPLQRAAVLAAALFGILCLAVGDVLTGTEASFTLLYLAPIAFGTWFVGLDAGIALSLVAALASSLADLVARSWQGNAAVVAWNLVIQLGVYLAMALLLAGFRSRLEGEQLLARTDGLTQVANRRAFIEAAELELERARRTGRPLTMAYVDCDDFKYVNDQLGHAEGDALLHTVAQTLRSSTRAVDAVARLGGDEFGLLLPETDGPTAQALLSRLNATLLAAMERRRWRVGFSMGAGTWMTPAGSVDQMMARADELMYQAKRTAKGTARFDVIGAAGAPALTSGPGPHGGT
jgi:diguanylate cyclase (GGDEF)-like protein